MRVRPSTAGALLLAAAPALVAAQETSGLRYDGRTLSAAELPPALRQQLYQLESQFADQRAQALDRYVIERVLEERAAERGMEVGELVAEMRQTVPAPDEAALRRFYDENRARIPGEFDEVKDQIAAYLQSMEVEEQVAALLEEARTEKGYEILLAEPEAPRFDVATDGFPAKGDEDAAVTVVEFADFQCPYCKAATPAIDALLERFGDDVRVVYRDLPVNPSGVSRRVAEGGVCAQEQGAFWEYHDAAFQRQAELDADAPMEIAAELDLDEDAFAACLADPATAERVEASAAEARSLGVGGTPSFFVNGRPLHVDGEVEQSLIGAVEEALAEAS